MARLLHLGEIVAVTVPSVEQEAARDLVRAREGVRRDLTSARHRLSKLLLRQGIVYYGGAPWTGPHDRWLRVQRREPVFGTRGLGTAFDIAYDTVLATTARRDRLDAAIAGMAADSLYTPVVTRLGCSRGVATLTAFGLAVEIGDWHRLTGRSIGAYLGLVPTESSSGASRSQGSITTRHHPLPGVGRLAVLRAGFPVRQQSTEIERCDREPRLVRGLIAQHRRIPRYRRRFSSVGTSRTVAQVVVRFLADQYSEQDGVERGSSRRRRDRRSRERGRVGRPCRRRRPRARRICRTTWPAMNRARCTPPPAIRGR